MKQYKPRVIDKILERKLRGKGAVLIEGPKWCGKTTTCICQPKTEPLHQFKNEPPT